MRQWILAFLLILCVPSLWAQEGRQTWVRGQDTLTYTYTPLPAPTSGTDSLAHKENFWRRVVNYFDRSNEDRTLEKGFDLTFIGGPSYSNTTQFGIGVMAAGLYRVDRTDSLTAPSNVSLYGSVSTTGFYTVGIRGNTIFRQDRHRLNYHLSFASQPTDFWGIGYEAGRWNPRSSYAEKRARVEVDYQYRIARHLYLGPQLHFGYTYGKDFTRPEYLMGMNRTALLTGLGAMIDYDTRDFAPNPWRGVHLSLSALYYPTGLGNCAESLWSVEFRAAGYQRLWPSAVLAGEIYGEFHSEGTPWAMMARLGGDNRMRGYYEGRYRDLDLITVQVELRQRIWRRISGVVWGGAGNLFPTLGDFTWSHTLPNYGLGLRWEFKKRVNIRFDYGFGKDTHGLVVQINEAF